MKIQQLVKDQQDFFNSNETKNISFRIKQLKKIKQLLQENEQELYDAIYADFGKSEFETYASEIGLIYHEINTCIRNTARWGTKQKVSTDLANFPAKSYIIPEPLGVTLVIGAWNYPYQLTLIPAISAMAAGNTVIMKPSELPARTSSIMAKIINNNFPEKYIHVVEGEVKTTNELLKNRFDKIFFTGSIPVGKIIYEAAAKNLTPVTLELGGKSPTFVLPDCDINVTAKRIVWAKFFNAGQTCVAPDYILVDQSIESKFLNALRAEIEKYYKKSNVLEENYVRIINSKNFNRLTQLIDQSKVYCGGTYDQKERIIHPTVLHNISFDDEIMKDEIFGPILPVISYVDIDKVIKQVKSRPKPLACYIYAKKTKTIEKILHEVSFGGGAVNDSVMHLSNSNLPFGGVGFSGIGSYHGKYGFDNFSHYKSVLHKPFWLEPTIKYAPYNKLKLTLIKWLIS